MIQVEITYTDGTKGGYTCTHAEVRDGVLRLEKGPNRQQSAIGMRDIEHVISVPLDKIFCWREE